MRINMLLTILFLCVIKAMPQQILPTQLLVVGGTTGGTAAGIQAARSGVQTIIVEETDMLGGMLTAAGVSCTDGNHQLYSGMWQQFRQALYQHYGTQNLASGWVSNNCFEPHVGDSIFKAWTSKEDKLLVLHGWYLDSVFTKGNAVTGTKFIGKDGKTLTIIAAITIDATEYGDVYAMSGAAYDLGMESPAYCGEKEAIEKNDIIQDITWSAILKNYGKGADRTINKPADYDASKYYCSTAEAVCTGKPYPSNTQKVLDYGKLTTSDTSHAKYMLNWPVHGNDFYLNAVETTPAKRSGLYAGAKNKTLGFIYFIQKDLGFKNIGLADDELDSGMALTPYNREARRLKGMVRLNINHIKKPYDYTLYKTGISVGDYPVDHHHGQYPGKAPEINFPQIPAFNIPLGALIPEKINGLVVCEKGISISNIANGSTRLQPVVLLTGQAAGIIAAQCIHQKIQPRDINVKAVQHALLKNKAYLMPFCDLTPADSAWAALQKVAAMGIIKGVGKNEAWENKMYCYPDSLMQLGALENNLAALFGTHVVNNSKQFVTQNSIVKIIDRYNKQFIDRSKTYKNKPQKHLFPSVLNVYNDTAIKNINSPLTRKQVCVMLDKYLLLVSDASIDLTGKMLF
ncbi:FAD-dependent oxidoreductase [soil metagenome]